MIHLLIQVIHFTISSLFIHKLFKPMLPVKVEQGLDQCWAFPNVNEESCKGATSGCVPSTRRRLGDPKISVLNSNEGHAQRRTWGIQREKAKDPQGDASLHTN